MKTHAYAPGNALSDPFSVLNQQLEQYLTQCPENPDLLLERITAFDACLDARPHHPELIKHLPDNIDRLACNTNITYAQLETAPENEHLQKVYEALIQLYHKWTQSWVAAYIPGNSQVPAALLLETKQTLQQSMAGAVTSPQDGLLLQLLQQYLHPLLHFTTGVTVSYDMWLYARCWLHNLYIYNNNSGQYTLKELFVFMQFNTAGFKQWYSTYIHEQLQETPGGINSRMALLLQEEHLLDVPVAHSHWLTPFTRAYSHQPPQPEQLKSIFRYEQSRLTLGTDTGNTARIEAGELSLVFLAVLLRLIASQLGWLPRHSIQHFFQCICSILHIPEATSLTYINMASYSQAKKINEDLLEQLHSFLIDCVNYVRMMKKRLREGRDPWKE